MQQLPPGPQLGRVAQGALLHRDPLGFLRRMRAEHGDVFTLRLAISGPMVIVAAPEAAPRIIDADPAHGHGGEARRRIVQMISPESVLGSDGQQHRTARSRLAPAFAAKALDRHREAMAQIAGAHAARWPRGRPFRLLPRVRTLCDTVFIRLVLGVRDEERATALVLAVRRMLWTPGNPPLPPPGRGSGLAGALGMRLFERRVAPVARLLADEVEARRRAGDVQGDDLLACMLRAEPPLATEQLVDQLVPVLMAGQEPPAAALTWLLDRLAREPHAAERFASASDEDAAWREAFVRETLRVRPAVHSVARRLTAPLELAGHRLPAGVVAVAPIVLLHRDAQAYPDADAFRPERFHDGTSDGAPYLPFGGGARRCLGEPLAHAMIGSVVPAILRAIRLRLLWPQPERMVVRGTVLVPHRSGLAVARDRSATSRPRIESASSCRSNRANRR
jgi:cytochrome P450 family 135